MVNHVLKLRDLRVKNSMCLERHRFWTFKDILYLRASLIWSFLKILSVPWMLLHFHWLFYRNSLPALVMGLVIGATTQYIKCSLPRTVGAAHVTTLGVWGLYVFWGTGGEGGSVCFDTQTWSIEVPSTWHGLRLPRCVPRCWFLALRCSEAILQLGETTWGQGEGSHCHFHLHKTGETVLPHVQNHAKKSDVKLMSLTCFGSI